MTHWRLILAVAAVLIAPTASAQSVGAVGPSKYWRAPDADPEALACSAAESYQVRLDTTDGELFYCDGSAWQALGGVGGSGDIESVGLCTSGACFLSVSNRVAFLGPALDDEGPPTFRAITEADISDLSHTTDTDTTCLDAGVDCLFAASTTEGGAATTATALAANGANCSAGQWAAGVDASGAAEGCTADDTGTDDQVAIEVPYTPATPTDWNDPDPADAGAALDDLAGRATTHEAAADAHHAQDHATTHSLGGADPVTVTNLASGCTDAQVLGGTAAGTGVECQADDTGGGFSSWEESGSDPTTHLQPTTGNTAGQVLANDGVVSVPGFAFKSEQGTGWRRQSAGRMDGIILGTAKLLITGSWVSTNATDLWAGTAGENPALMSETASAANPTLVPQKNDSNTGIGGDGSDGVYLVAGGTTGISVTTTENVLHFEQVNPPKSRTCTDSGDGNPGTLIATVSGSTYLAVTVSDSDGCNLTLSETGASNGQRLEILAVSIAGGTLDLADTAGIQNISGVLSMGVGDAVTFRYDTTLGYWAEISRSDN